MLESPSERPCANSGIGILVRDCHQSHFSVAAFRVAFNGGVAQASRLDQHRCCTAPVRQRQDFVSGARKIVGPHTQPIGARFHLQIHSFPDRALCGIASPSTLVGRLLGYLFFSADVLASLAVGNLAASLQLDFGATVFQTSTSGDWQLHAYKIHDASCSRSALAAPIHTSLSICTQ
jgi:hypothetical protein